jgi:PAS domain S-box-containing protein
MIGLVGGAMSEGRPDEPSIREALAFAQSIIATVREPLVILDEGLRVHQANRSFYETFAVEQGETEGRLIYELGGRQWDIPELRRLLEDILANRSAFEDFEVEREFERIGRKTMLLNARKLHLDGGKILLAIEDITERRRAERALGESQSRATDILESITDAFISLGRDWRFTYANRQAESLLGRASADLIGKVIWDEYPALIGTEFEGAYLRAASDGISTAVTAFYPEHARWYEVHAYPAREGLSVYFRDVSDRIQAEEAIRKNEAWLQTVTDTLPALVSYIDRDLRYRFANRSYVEWFGKGPGQVVGKSLREVLGDSIFEQRRPYIEAALRGEEVRFEGPTEHIASGRRQTEIIYRPHVDEGGVVGFFAHVLDITGRKEIEESLRRSEEKYRTLFNSIDDGFCVVEVEFDAADRPVDYRFLEINPAFEKHTGLRGAEGKTARELVPGLDDFWFETYGRIARTGHPERFVHEAGAMAGRWFDVYAFRLGGPGSRKLAILFGDVTDRRRAEQALQESQGRLQLAVEIAQMGTFEIDLLTDAVTVNEPGRAIYGWPDVHTTFSLVQTHFHPDDKDEVMRKVGAAFDPDGPRTFEVEQRILRVDGAVRWIKVRGRALFDESGAVARAVRCVGTYLDITERKSAEEERERLLSAAQASRDEAQAANRMKDEFLATLSHELRTPLNAILGWAKILRSGRFGGEDLEEGLAAIERNSTAQAQIIEDLLDVSRIVSGNFKLEIQRVNIPEIIEAAVASVAPAATAKDIRIHRLLDPLAGPVMADPARLQQVAWNLLSNAVKFTPRGGEVRVVLERVASNVELSVIDTGQGIRPEFLPYVFDRFRQADSTTTRRHGGLGLGLAIVKQLVEMHGGTARAESPGEGRGATFTVALPFTAMPAGRHEPTKVRPDESGTAGDLCKDRALAGVRVLVLDDEPDARQLIWRVLSECEAEVALASSADEALELVERFRPDVIVSDIGMPDKDGYEFIREIRSKRNVKELPAAALTAFARAEDRRQAMLAGFQTHVAKPVDPAELVAVVASLAGRTQGA